MAEHDKPGQFSGSKDTGLVVYHHTCGITGISKSSLFTRMLCALFGARGRVEAVHSGAHAGLVA